MAGSRLAFIEFVDLMKEMLKDDPFRLAAAKKYEELLEEKYELYGLCSCDEPCHLHGEASLDMFTENNYKMLRNFIDYVERDLDFHLRLHKCEDKSLRQLLRRIQLMKYLYKENER